MSWISNWIGQAACNIGNAMNRAGENLTGKKQEQNLKQEQTTPDEKGAGKAQQENESPQKERAKQQAQKMKGELDKQGILQQGQEVNGPDGGIPYTPGSSNGNSNSSGEYNPPREPRSSYRGKAQDTGRER